MRDDEKWSRAAFCAHSSTLAPDQVEVIIGVPPTRSHRIGEPRGKSGTHDRNYYSIQSSIASSISLDAHIEEILSILEPRKEQLKKLEREATLCIFCGFSSGNGQGGFTLSPELLSRLARIGLRVVMDLYPPEGEST